MITMIKIVLMEHVKDVDILWKIFAEIRPSDVNFPGSSLTQTLCLKYGKCKAVLRESGTLLSLDLSKLGRKYTVPSFHPRQRD